MLRRLGASVPGRRAHADFVATKQLASAFCGGAAFGLRESRNPWQPPGASAPRSVDGAAVQPREVSASRPTVGRWLSGPREASVSRPTALSGRPDRGRFRPLDQRFGRSCLAAGDFGPPVNGQSVVSVRSREASAPRITVWQGARSISGDFGRLIPVVRVVKPTVAGLPQGRLVASATSLRGAAFDRRLRALPWLGFGLVMSILSHVACTTYRVACFGAISSEIAAGQPGSELRLQTWRGDTSSSMRIVSAARGRGSLRQSIDACVMHDLVSGKALAGIRFAVLSGAGRQMSSIQSVASSDVMGRSWSISPLWARVVLVCIGFGRSSR